MKNNNIINKFNIRELCVMMVDLFTIIVAYYVALLARFDFSFGAIPNNCDVRIIWGGDATIADLRKSNLKPRSTEITFADRYSLAVIDSDKYRFDII